MIYLWENYIEYAQTRYDKIIGSAHPSVVYTTPQNCSLLELELLTTA